MQMINYEQLLKKHKRCGHLSSDANTIANILVRELQIQGGSGLARFLDVDACFDNYMAIRVWVQKQLDTQDSYIVHETCNQLERELYGLLPQIHGY